MHSGDSSDSDAATFFPATPLFPLPNVVLFPRAVLPLHIFEERYKAMTAHALASEGRIAMALLKTGWEKNYYGSAAIEPVVCVGRILTHEELPDGKYNFLLQGIARCRITREHRGEPFRVADLETLEEEAALDIDLEDHRRRIEIALRGDLGGLPGSRQFLQMLTSPMATSTVADLIAFHLLEDIPTKQALLSEQNVHRRVTHLVEALEAIKPEPPVPPVTKVRFPPNPSMN